MATALGPGSARVRQDGLQVHVMLVSVFEPVLAVVGRDV